MKVLDYAVFTCADSVAKFVKKKRIAKRDIQSISVNDSFAFIYYWKKKDDKKK